MNAEQSKLSFDQVLGVIRRRLGVIVSCLVISLVVAYGVSRTETKKYTATASLVFNNQQLSQQVAGLQVSNSNSQQALQSTNLTLVQLGDMATKTAASVGKGLTRKKVVSDLSITPHGESNVVNVAATATSPVLAAEIANTYTQTFVNEQESSNHAYYAAALALVEKQLHALKPVERAGTAGLALQSRAQSLGTLAELRNGNVQVAQEALLPTAPSSPKTKRNTIVGGLLGLLGGLAIAFLIEHFDRRIRDPKDLEAIYGLPLLGVIPQSSSLSSGVRRGDGSRAVLPPTEAEAFHLIRARLRYFNVDNALRVLMVVSAAPGDGKTTVARYLAAVTARMGASVLLIDADLRRPNVSRSLDLNSGPGLVDVLIGAVPFADAIQSVEVEPGAGPSRTLDVLVAGAVLAPNPGELIESHSMEALLELAKQTYELIVIDTAPMTAVSDAMPLLGRVDGVIIVGRVERNRRDVAERLHETLLGANAPLLGVIANGFKTRVGSYGYSYDYAAVAPSSNGAGAPQRETVPK